MLDVPRCIAGVFAGAASLLLIYQGQVTEGAIIVTALVAFFTGEANGQRKVSEET